MTMNVSDSQSCAAAASKSTEFKRRLVFNRSDVLLLPLLFLLPLLALFEVFDESHASVSARHPQFDMLVQYTKRTRYSQDADLTVVVRNTGAQPLAQLTVAFDQGYLTHFSRIKFNTKPNTVTRRTYEVRLKNLLSGESRLIHVALLAEHAGQHEGHIEAVTKDGPVARLAVSTLIFP